MIAGLLITYQCVIQDYPVEACIRSLLAISDVVYVNDGGSTDGTLDTLKFIQADVGSDRLVVIERKWVHDRHFWARERNYILDNIIKGKDVWVLSLDADEVLHEAEFDDIKAAMSKQYDAVSFNVIHFYGTPFNVIRGGAWFSRHTQLWKLVTGIRWLHREGGCADDIVWPDGTPAHLTRYTTTEASLYHYGHCRSPKAMGMKVKRADDLYRYSNTYIDGSLATLSSWKYDMNREGIHNFDGSHPSFVNDWVREHKHQSLEYIVKE